MRTQQLKAWLAQELDAEHIELMPLTGDAGFRCYFRFNHNHSSYIAVDAPPEYSNNQAFVNIQQFLDRQELRVPAIIAKNLELGFFCLSDFGDELLADRINHNNVSQYYTRALEQLQQVVSKGNLNAVSLPDYNADFIRQELAIFSQWLLSTHLSLRLDDGEKLALAQCFDFLVDEILSQPTGFMHRDFHSRNIMVLADNELGIIDFQDAVVGPITYDLVSLLRDCYVRWPDDIVQPLVEQYRLTMQSKYLTENLSQENWQKWFDLTGVQRHIKASGIFARLHHRDGKSGYLKDIPLTLTYIQDISAQYGKLNFLHSLVKNRVIPAINLL